MKRVRYSLFALMVAGLLAACGTTASAPAAAPSPAAGATALPPQPTPAALAALAGRTSPCDAPAIATPAAPIAALPAGAVHYDSPSNTILLRRGAQATLSAIAQALGKSEVLRELAPGEWLLSGNLRVEAGAELRIAGPAARRLKLRSDSDRFVWIKALGGTIEMADTCVSSWDPLAQRPDEHYEDGRSFVLARDGGRMNIARSDLSYLGYNGPEAYGLAWRVRGTTGQIIDSAVSHNFYGIYSYDMDDLIVRGNEVHHNVMYGIDPHTRSNRLVIEGNVAHDNGKHGIILAEECSDGQVRNNVAYGNLHHGIAIYQRSNNNLVEGNTSYGNGGQGINVNDAAGTLVRSNSVYDNLEAGIGVGQRASSTQLIGNQVQFNRGHGITLYSEAADTTLRDNRIAGNARYGLYVKSAGALAAEGNTIEQNDVGVVLNIAGAPAVSEQANRIAGNHAADLRDGEGDSSAGAEGE